MSYIGKIINYLRHPRKIVIFMNAHGFHRLIPDTLLLRCLYEDRLGKRLDLENPKTFNEKLQWLKLHNRNPIYTKLVDKYEVKQFVADKIGDEYIVPTIGLWEKYEDIDFDLLPDQFVLKCTHDSGGLVICRDKGSMDWVSTEAKIKKSLKRNYFYSGREWPYKNVPPRVLAEEYLEDTQLSNLGMENNLTVYKVFNFHGEPRIIQVIQNDKQPNETIDYFDTKWKLLELKQNFPNSERHIDKPAELQKMLGLAKKLSESIPFVRTDFYVVNNRIFFSEYTFFSDCGTARFQPEEWDWIFGGWIHLPMDSGKSGVYEEAK